MKRSRQSGFTTVEGVLIIVILCIIGFTGWYAWSRNQSHDTKPVATVASNKSKTPATGQKSAASDSSRQDSLEIKEWGVKIPLSSSIATAVYSSSQYSTGSSSATGGSAKLGLLSLGGDCADSSSAPLGQYVEFTKSDVNNENLDDIDAGPSLHELFGAAVEIPGSDGGYGGYYVAYVAPIFNCTNDTATLNAAITAFQQALKDIK